MLVSALAKVAVAIQLLGAANGFNFQPFPRDLNTPSQQRLAYLGVDGITVSWNTFQQLGSATVKYGLDANNLNQIAQSDVSVTYPTSTTWNSHVPITGLQPGTTYYYQIENDSQVYTFTTAKAAGTNEEFSFAVVIDMGTMGDLGLSDHGPKAEGGKLAKGEQTTIDSLTQSLSEFEFVLHPGDIAYADYWLKEEYQGYLPNTTIADGYKVYEQILNGFYDQVKPISSVKPYMVGVGNHEADCDNGGYKSWTNSICSPGQTNFTGYKTHWRMPGEKSNGEGNMWYSFDYGLVHYIQYDTETDFPNGLKGPESKAPNGNVGDYPNEQLDWLVNDLKNVDRTKTPWVIALGHRPWYVAGEGCDTCQQAFESTLNQYGVDIIVAGHVHNYERIGPIGTGGAIDANGLNNPSSPLYILNGIAGHYDGLDPLSYPLPNYVNFAQDSAYGWSKFTVHNCTHITHEFVSSSNNTVLDRATLFKDRPCVDNKNTTSSSVPASSSTIASSGSSSASASASGSAAGSSTASGSASGSASGKASISGSTTATAPGSGSESTVTDKSTTIVTITSCSDNKCSEIISTSTIAPATSSSSVPEEVETVTKESTTVITVTSCSDKQCTKVVSTSTLTPGQVIPASTSTVAKLSTSTSTSSSSSSAVAVAPAVSVPGSPAAVGTTTAAAGKISSAPAPKSVSTATTTLAPGVTTANSANLLSPKNVFVAAIALFAI